MTGGDAVAADTEADIYTALGLPYIPPEMREDRGELALTEIPKLIEIGDIRAELHAHTVASDGRFTIETLARCAADRGYHTVAVTDHSQSSGQANGLSPERLIEHIEAIHAADTEIDGITILAGAEVDILADGRLDYDDELLARLDVVVASPHSTLRQDPDTATRRLLAAIRHPLVHILGHPTGRILNRREGLHPDMTRLFEAAVEHNTAMEINANSLRLDLRDIHVRAAVGAGALIAVNTDAHRTEHFDELRYGIMTARRGWLEAEHCVNTWAAGKLMRWLRSKR
jgi:DNA polymerase (family 10)